MEILKLDKSQGELVYELFDKYRVFYKQPSNIEVSKRFIQERINKGESIIFVALVNDTPVGFTQLYPIFSSVRVIQNWILNDLYVLKKHRKSGIGEALIKTAMNFANESGANYLQLSTAVDNFMAQRLYERIGFFKLEPESDFYSYRISTL